ncbi:MAG: hypothetical protein K2X48_05695 [Chitinophagaceae bacterium]|nr:hypothetical protein [Chitinophagaceae bacterium]
MKPKSSPLNIIDYALLNFEFGFIEPKGTEKTDIRSAFENYELDIDFAIHGNEVLQVFIKASINKGAKKLPGYSIFAEVACAFEFNKNFDIEEKAKQDIGGFSTIYIALNALRGLISQITANAPFGRYMLPSIDLNDLIAQKKQIVTKQKNKALNSNKNKKTGGKRSLK